MRNLLTILSVVASLSLLVPAASAQYITVELTIEAFDGCGCQPLNPPNCGTCDNLNGSGCNAHDGLTNNPDSYCSSLTGWPHPFPNRDYHGSDSIDQSWGNIGGAMDYSGDYQVKNGIEPANQASQKFVMASGRLIKAAWPWEGGALGYIDPHNPQDIVGNTYGRMHVEEIRQAYNAAHPDTPLPPPVADQPTYMTIDLRRVGGGLVGQPALTLKPSVWPPTVNPDPTDLLGTYHNGVGENEVPNDSAWHTYRLVDFNKCPVNVYMGLYFDFMVGNGGTSATTNEDVAVWIDNLKLVYQAVPFAENCSNGFDDDGDGLIDCADPDCYFTPSCPCNPYVVFDVDNDGDVDQADFGFMQGCVTGAGDPGGLFDTLSDACKCLDVSGAGGVPDQAIDQQDLVAFELCASGPGIAASPTCDD